MRILSLIENTSATDGLAAEHGLSLYIEFGGKRFLLDTGASGKFADNAKKMGVDLSTLDAAIISHNHIDHTGGLERLLEECPDITIYMRQNARGIFEKRVALVNVPISTPVEFFEKHRRNFVLFDSFRELTSGFFLCANEVLDREFFCCDGKLRMRVMSKSVPDDFSHELFIAAFPKESRSDGCVIISSCSHSGIVNIMRTVRENWNNTPILGVVGGFHIMGSSTKQLNCSPEYVERVCSEIRDMDTGTLYTCHCTGIKGYEAMKYYLKDQIQYLQTGEELEF